METSNGMTHYLGCLILQSKKSIFTLFSLSVAFGVAHQAVEEVSPGGDTILVQG